MRIVALPLVVVSLLLLGTALSVAGEDKTVFESRCSACHGLERPLRKNKDRSGWEKTVNRMKKYASGAITDDEAARIIDYLVQTRGPAQ